MKAEGLEVKTKATTSKKYSLKEAMVDIKSEAKADREVTRELFEQQNSLLKSLFEGVLATATKKRKSLVHDEIPDDSEDSASV